MEDIEYQVRNDPAMAGKSEEDIQAEIARRQGADGFMPRAPEEVQADNPFAKMTLDEVIAFRKRKEDEVARLEEEGKIKKDPAFQGMSKEEIERELKKRQFDKDFARLNKAGKDIYSLKMQMDGEDPYWLPREEDGSLKKFADAELSPDKEPEQPPTWTNEVASGASSVEGAESKPDLSALGTDVADMQSTYKAMREKVLEEKERLDGIKKQVRLGAMDLKRWELGDEHRNMKLADSPVDQNTIDEMTNRDRNEFEDQKQAWQTTRMGQENLYSKISDIELTQVELESSKLGKSADEQANIDKQIQRLEKTKQGLQANLANLNKQLDMSKAPDYYTRYPIGQTGGAQPAQGEAPQPTEEELVAIAKKQSAVIKSAENKIPKIWKKGTKQSKPEITARINEAEERGALTPDEAKWLRANLDKIQEHTEVVQGRTGDFKQVAEDQNALAVAQAIKEKNNTLYDEEQKLIDIIEIYNNTKKDDPNKKIFLNDIKRLSDNLISTYAQFGEEINTVERDPTMKEMMAGLIKGFTGINIGRSMPQFPDTQSKITYIRNAHKVRRKM